MYSPETTNQVSFEYVYNVRRNLNLNFENQTFQTYLIWEQMLILQAFLIRKVSWHSK